MNCSSLQAIGYFAATDCEKDNPGVVCVLSEKSLDVVIFPFISSEGLLVNAVRIPFPFPDDRYSCIACIVALLVHPKKIQLCVRYPGTKRTVTKQHLQLVVHRSEMEELMKTLKKERLKHEAEIEKEKREKLEERLKHGVEIEKERLKHGVEIEKERLKHGVEIEKLKEEIEELKSKC